MIEEYAVVAEVFDDHAKLEIERKTACGLCGQKRGCGNATWGKLLGHQTQFFHAKNSISAKVGDSVVVGIDERSILDSTLLMYVLPLFGLLGATVFAEIFFTNQLYVALCAAQGLFFAFLLAKYLANSRLVTINKSNHHFQAVILRLANDECLPQIK